MVGRERNLPLWVAVVKAQASPRAEQRRRRRQRLGTRLRDAGVTEAANVAEHLIGVRDVLYTLWSRGRLLGETHLGFIYRHEGFRCGWFHPTTLGERLMPAATGVAPAMRTERMIGPDANARADVLAAIDQEEALKLQLRGPDGAVIATTNIGIIDTHYLLSIPDADTDGECDVDADEEADQEAEQEAEALIEELEANCEGADFQLTSAEETVFPRCQIQVYLAERDWLP